jgi:hypothetical protein
LTIDYHQIGLNFILHASEVLFNRAIVYCETGDIKNGTKDLKNARYHSVTNNQFERVRSYSIEQSFKITNMVNDLSLSKMGLVFKVESDRLFRISDERKDSLVRKKFLKAGKVVIDAGIGKSKEVEKSSDESFDITSMVKDLSLSKSFHEPRSDFLSLKDFSPLTPFPNFLTLPMRNQTIHRPNNNLKPIKTNVNKLDFPQRVYSSLNDEIISSYADEEMISNYKNNGNSSPLDESGNFILTNWTENAYY